MSSSGKVKCTCGWSWNKSDSSKKDMYICHECGRDNSNNMKNGGWLDSYADGGTMQEHQENYNDNSVSLPEGFVGEGYNTKGRNYSPAWGGQFQMGGSLPGATGHMYARYKKGGLVPGDVGFNYPRTGEIPSNGPGAKKTMASAQDGKTFPEFKKIVPKSEEQRLRESLKERPRAVVKESIQAPKLPSRKNIKESTLTEKGNVKRDNKGRVVIQNDEEVYTPYQPGVDQVTLTQDDRNTEVKEKLKEYSDVVRNPSMIDKAAFLGELPLNYLSDPTKILGDLGIQGVNDSSEDFDSFVKEVNYPFPASNSLQRGLERQLPKAPSAALNLALASIGTNSLGQTLLEAYNPIPGFDIRHSFGPKRNMITTPSIGRISGDDFDIDLPLNGRNINGIDDAVELYNPTSDLARRFPKRIDQPLKKELEPFISKRVFNDTREQQIYESSFPTRQQNILMERRTKYYDPNGNEIPKPERFKFDGEESILGMKQGGVIKDDMGQWNHPGEITEIGSPYITMQGVPYDVLGISDTGDTKLMKPGKNYKFKGKKVTEFPMAKNGLRQEQKGLVNLDQLTNFTNYNTKQPGGWLDKY